MTLAIQNLNGNITRAYKDDPTNRWLDNLTNEEHHSLPAVSSTAVKYFYKNSEQAFYRKYISHELKEFGQREEFRIGTLIHLAILEPEKFEKYVKVCDDDQRTISFKEYRQKLMDILNNRIKTIEPVLVDTNSKNVAPSVIEPVTISGEKLLDLMNSKKTKETVEIIEPKKIKKNHKKSTDIIIETQEPDNIVMGKNGGYILKNGEELYLVKSHEMNMYRSIQKNAEKHSRLGLMLADCVIEQSGIAQCPRTGLFLSCRGDARHENGYFIDPKSINKLSPYDMEYAVGTYQYYLQHIHYLYVANLIEPGRYKYFYFLFVSKENYEVCLWHLDQEDIDYASEVYFKTLDRLAKCEKERRWTSWDGGNGMIGKIPYWAKRA